ncbi:hypothetical protein ABIQ69_12655 [Agromyces sp. G08B096]|uniref:Uncharacterized protein n=1 Tax=Agromyces sp. G08B096 TaxID=3156399 RepID=A0AAU7W551_9MICO
MQIAIIAVPLIGVAAWSEQQSNPGFRSAIVWSVLIVAVAVLYAVFRYRLTSMSVSRYGIVERGFFGGITSVPARDAAAVIRLELYRGASDETSPQLFVVDRDGRCLIRMRGAFWDTEDMDVVASALEVGEFIRPTPVTLGELRASDPKLLYWFERLFAGRETGRRQS